MVREPYPNSSPGWNMSFTVPGSSASMSFRIWAAPRSMAAWASCPHMWLNSPWGAKGNPLFSLMGRASMSARRSRQGPPCPIRPTTPVDSGISPNPAKRSISRSAGVWMPQGLGSMPISLSRPLT